MQYSYPVGDVTPHPRARSHARSTVVPRSSRSQNYASNINLPQTLDAKKEWNEHFEAYIRDLDTKKPVIWSGDLNVAPTALGECSLFTPSITIWPSMRSIRTRAMLGGVGVLYSGTVTFPQHPACARSSFQALPPVHVITSFVLEPSFLAPPPHIHLSELAFGVC